MESGNYNDIKFCIELLYNFYYKRDQLTEILFLVKKGFTYSDILSMPVYVRRYYLQFIMEMENPD